MTRTNPYAESALEVVGDGGYLALTEDGDLVEVVGRNPFSDVTHWPVLVRYVGANYLSIFAASDLQPLSFRTQDLIQALCGS